MLVLLGPSYAGSDREIEILAQETGLTGYDLRARLRPGTWGVIRAIADDGQAEQLAQRLVLRGLPACAISSAVGQEPERKIVYLRGLRLDTRGISLRLVERTIAVPYGALLAIVRGEVHVGRGSQVVGAAGKTGSLRPSASALGLRSGGTAAQEVLQESRSQVEQDVFAAADIHFATVPWVARIDARELDFPTDYVDITNLAERMDRCVDDLARVADIRVDRGVRTSSLAAHTAGPARSATPLPGSLGASRRGQGPSDEHFDAYSRLIGEAERRLLELHRPG